MTWAASSSFVSVISVIILEVISGLALAMIFPILSSLSDASATTVLTILVSSSSLSLVIDSNFSGFAEMTSFITEPVISGLSAIIFSSTDPA